MKHYKHELKESLVKETLEHIPQLNRIPKEEFNEKLKGGKYNGKRKE